MRSPSKASEGRIAGYSTDEQRSGVRCMDGQKCDFILSSALSVSAARGLVSAGSNSRKFMGSAKKGEHYLVLNRRTGRLIQINVPAVPNQSLGCSVALPKTLGRCQASSVPTGAHHPHLVSRSPPSSSSLEDNSIPKVSPGLRPIEDSFTRIS